MKLGKRGVMNQKARKMIADYCYVNETNES